MTGSHWLDHGGEVSADDLRAKSHQLITGTGGDRSATFFVRRPPAADNLAPERSIFISSHL